MLFFVEFPKSDHMGISEASNIFTGIKIVDFHHVVQFLQTFGYIFDVAIIQLHSQRTKCILSVDVIICYFEDDECRRRENFFARFDCFLRPFVGRRHSGLKSGYIKSL